MKCKRYALECKRGCADKCACENSYLPSNGSEGEWFMNKYCCYCIHENVHLANGKRCDLLTKAMCLYPTEPGYPLEWIYDVNKSPICTKWIRWDWNKDGDPDDPDNPNRPPDPPDPRQLNLFPLYHLELNINQTVSV